MCRRVTCEKCGRPTFAGCGLHIESVLGDVPAADRCQGHAPGEKSAGTQQPSSSTGGGVMDAVKGLFGRRGS